MDQAEVAILVAVLGALGALGAAIVAASAQRAIRRLEAHRAATTFLREKLNTLYLPMSMQLRATRALSETHYGADEATKTEIEHALHVHNGAIVDRLMEASMYLDPDAPKGVMDLLAHLLQWESVYKLKYDRKMYDETIWEVIRSLGYTQFPDGIDDHFHDRATAIRRELHERLEGGG